MMASKGSSENECSTERKRVKMGNVEVFELEKKIEQLEKIMHEQEQERKKDYQELQVKLDAVASLVKDHFKVPTISMTR